MLLVVSLMSEGIRFHAFTSVLPLVECLVSTGYSICQTLCLFLYVLYFFFSFLWLFAFILHCMCYFNPQKYKIKGGPWPSPGFVYTRFLTHVYRVFNPRIKTKTSKTPSLLFCLCFVSIKVNFKIGGDKH